ncbi:MAG: hypothetical protein V1921_06410 [Candidatus Altiarchaeota archaeon]
MTGTKVVKLKLDGSGKSKELPSLMDGVVEKAAAIVGELEPLVGGWNHVYEHIEEKTRRMHVTPKQLQDMIEIGEHQYLIEIGEHPYSEVEKYSWKMGLLVSALINSSPHDNFTVKTEIPLCYLGYRLKEGKKITVESKVDESVGRENMGGHIHVKKNAGWYAGADMRTGLLEIDGDAGRATGARMKGGELHVKGDTEFDTAVEMEGGKLIIDGKAMGAGHSIKGGEIWEAGKKVFSR